MESEKKSEAEAPEKERFVSFRVGDHDGKVFGYVITRDGKRVVAGLGEELRARVAVSPSGNVSVDHAYVIEENRQAKRAKSAEDLFEEIAPKLRRFLGEVIDHDPDLDTGELSEIHIEVGRAGWDDVDDSPYFSVSTETRHRSVDR